MLLPPLPSPLSIPFSPSIVVQQLDYFFEHSSLEKLCSAVFKYQVHIDSHLTSLARPSCKYCKCMGMHDAAN